MSETVRTGAPEPAPSPLPPAPRPASGPASGPARPASLLAELEWRGLLYDHTDRLADALAAGPVTGYCGFDPTADSLHVGNLIPVMGLLHLQRTGHRPIILIGGGTGLIGDPSGKAAERQLLAPEQIAANGRAIRQQLEGFLEFGGPRGALVRDNADWLTPLSAVALLRDIGKHFSINYMLAKDSVQSRLEGGISFTEFAYMLLQATDFLELHRRDGATLQLGGSDQWGNITAGIELIRRTTGASAHGLVLPLVTTASGTKFGKTEAGAVWLDPQRTSPYQFYQFWINADDRDVVRYLRYFTLRPREEIAALETAMAAAPERREAQETLAFDITSRVHGEALARSAQRVSAVLFGGSARALSADELLLLKREMPNVEVRRDRFVAPVGVGAGPPVFSADLVDLAVEARIVSSRSEARRLIQQGGLYANDERVTPENTRVGERDLLPGNALILRKGARHRTFIQFL